MVVNPDGSVQFEGDVGKLMRGAGAAADQGGLMAQNRAARLAKYGTEQVAKMETAGARFGGAASAASTGGAAAPSVATATNPAPVATSTAASGTTFGQRALRSLRLGGRLLGAAGVASVGADTAMTVGNKSTEDYEKQLSGLGVQPGKRYGSDTLQLARDIGVRGLGSLVDLGQAVNPFSSGGARAAAPAAPGAGPAATSAVPATTIPSGVNAYPSTDQAPSEVQALVNGRLPVPALGTGAAVNNRTGRTLAFNTGLPTQVASGGGGNVEPASTALPVLGTEGGIFSNLSKFSKELSAHRGAAAASGQTLNRALRIGGLNVKQSEAESRGVAALGTFMRGQAAVANSGESGKKVTTDLMGNPVIVNTRAGTALAPTVKKPVSETDIAETMKTNKMSREAVVARLRAEGRMD